MRTEHFAILAALLSLSSLAVRAQDADAVRCNRIFAYAFEHELIGKPIGDVVRAVADRFIGAPYEAGTLDRSPEEKLVEDLHSFDCVTFVESVTGLALCIKEDRLSHAAFLAALERIRYRNGKCAGYASRLHYFTEWIADNSAKGIIRDITGTLGGTPARRTINFLTRHPSGAPGRSDSSLAALRSVEQHLSDTSYSILPASRVKGIEPSLVNGDLVACVSREEGLDISHTGFIAIDDRGVPHLLHASETSGKIEITRDSLSGYLRHHPKFSGIIVARVLPPR